MVKAVTKWALRQLVSVPAVRRYLQDHIGHQIPPIEPTARSLSFPAGHFYSPLPDLAQVEKEVGRLYAPPSADDGVRLNPDEQWRLLAALSEYSPGFDWGEHATPARRFFLNNGFFGHGDAAVLYSIIRHFRPLRIIEVGSGFSSALMLDTNELHCEPKMELCFIEPYPDRLESILKEGDKASARLITAPVQEVPLTEFDALGPNDILFIDSSHVAKVGSDLNHLFFSVFPRLRSGVLIHLHDVFYPFEYPLSWLRQGLAWNEIYLLRAFLQYNSAFDVLFFNGYLWHHSPQSVKEHLPAMGVNPGGSIWLRKTDLAPTA